MTIRCKKCGKVLHTTEGIIIHFLSVEKKKLNKDMVLFFGKYGKRNFCKPVVCIVGNHFSFCVGKRKNSRYNRFFQFLIKIP